jgi:hypothetical protein
VKPQGFASTLATGLPDDLCMRLGRLQGGADFIRSNSRKLREL